ncbi:MAG: DUF5054 domain-containing protein [Acidobacteriaceae bacterium]
MSRVLVMFKCHLDIGFSDTQARVIDKYFGVYYPNAIDIAETMRESGTDRYVWTTGSWLLFEYLDQANSSEKKRMEKAIARGDIAWHALPFSWQTELLDPTMIDGAIGFSKSLDRRFGRVTTGAKMTDVPGHSRGIVSSLARNGVKLLDIGVNSSVTPPQVPPIFVWQDLDGSRVVMLYHHDYGGIVQVPHSDLAISVEMRADNSGPHTVEEIKTIYADLRRQFPNASITAANLSDIANAVQPLQKNLPVITNEIGDTWIYGAGSDPVKMARYREVSRLRREWIDQGKLAVGDVTDLTLLRKLSLSAEHTWGTDTEAWLDLDCYTSHDLVEVLNQANYQIVETSWKEKRDDLNHVVTNLPSALRVEAENRIASLTPTRPEWDGLERGNPGHFFETPHFIVQLDPATGAITRLTNRQNGREWASARHPLALFAYQTLSQRDYDAYVASYLTVKFDWAIQGVSKPNIERVGARSREWHPRVKDCWTGKTLTGDRLLAQLSIDDDGAKRSGLVAWPDTVYLELLFPEAEPVIHINLTWFGKAKNRLPEAMWLSFQPDAPEPRGWVLQKVDQPVSPFDVVCGGNRHMHGLSTGLSYKDRRGSLVIESLDAPLVALGEKSPIHFSNSQPDLAKGVHFCLFNNAYGTNYVQWFGEDMRFRFTVRA